MRPLRVFHADGSISSRAALRSAIRKQTDMRLVGEAGDGAEAERLIDLTHPDAVVMCVALAGLDGFDLLRRLRSAACRPRVLILSSLHQERFVERAMRLGADYYMLKPCPEALICERLRELQCVAARAAEARFGAPEEAYAGLLNAMNVPNELIGYQYIGEGVDLIARNPQASVCKEVYPAIASRRSTSPGSVERAIRHAICAAWATGENKLRERFFPSGARPGNGAFLQRLAREVALQERAHALDPAAFL